MRSCGGAQELMRVESTSSCWTTAWLRGHWRLADDRAGDGVDEHQGHDTPDTVRAAPPPVEADQPLCRWSCPELARYAVSAAGRTPTAARTVSHPPTGTGAPVARTYCSRSAPAFSTTPLPTTTDAGTPASPTPTGRTRPNSLPRFVPLSTAALTPTVRHPGPTQRHPVSSEAEAGGGVPHQPVMATIRRCSALSTSRH